MKIERHESYRGRITPDIEWRVWNAERTSYMPFKTQREAVAYEGIKTTKGRFVLGNHTYQWMAEHNGKTEYADTKSEAVKRLGENR